MAIISEPKLFHQILALPIALVIALQFLILANKVHSQTDSITFNFGSFTGRETNLTYQGDAHIPSRSSALRLTGTYPICCDFPPPPRPNSVGRVLYSRPMRLWDRVGRRQATFQTQLRFVVSGAWSEKPADGIVFFIAPVNSTIPSGSYGGNFGIYGSSGTSSSLFAVEFDYFINSWDPSFRHIGININSRNSASVRRWEINDAFPVVDARITYDSRERLITVVAESFQVLSRLDYVIDLKTILPEWVQVGIAASTGELYYAVHDINRWSFISFMVFDDGTKVEDNSGNEYINNQNNSTNVEDTYIPQYV